MWEETSLNETQTIFETLKQYYWDRDVFCETIQNVIHYLMLFAMENSIKGSISLGSKMKMSSTLFTKPVA